MTMVIPSCVIFCSCLTSRSELVASSPEVGSSRKSSEGQAASSVPTLTRLRCPPLRPWPVARLPTSLLCWGSSCSTCRTSFVTLNRCFFEVPLSLRRAAEKKMFSRTVSFSCTMSSCGTKPTTFLSCERSPSWPLICVDPPTSKP